MALTFEEGVEIKGGTLRIYQEPRRDRHYSLGLDFAYGLEDGDYDAGVIFDEFGDQVATVHGHWGVMAFPDVLWPLLEWYEPFVMGERQVGLPVLQTLWERGYRWLYYHRREDTPERAITNSLGHHASNTDLIIPTLRRAIGLRGRDGLLQAPKIRIRDPELLEQLFKFGFRPRSSRMSIEEAKDRDLVWGAPSGETDDLVMAAAYSVRGIVELPKFIEDKKPFPAGSWGHVLDHHDVAEQMNRRTKRNRLRRGPIEGP